MNRNPKSLIEAAQLADTYCVNHTVYSCKSYKSTISVEVKQTEKPVQRNILLSLEQTILVALALKANITKSNIYLIRLLLRLNANAAVYLAITLILVTFETSGLMFSLHIISRTVISWPVNRYIQDMIRMCFTITS